MQKNILRKGLIIIVIGLFFGASITLGITRMVSADDPIVISDLLVEVSPNVIFAGMNYSEIHFDIFIVDENDEIIRQPDDEGLIIRIIDKSGSDVTGSIGNIGETEIDGKMNRTLYNKFIQKPGTYTVFAHNDTHNSFNHNETLVVNSVDITLEKIDNVYVSSQEFVFLGDDNVSATFSVEYNGAPVDGILRIDNISTAGSGINSYNKTWTNTLFTPTIGTTSGVDKGGNISKSYTVSSGVLIVNDITPDYLPFESASKVITFYFKPSVDESAWAKSNGIVFVKIPDVEATPSMIQYNYPAELEIKVSGRGIAYDNLIVNITIPGLSGEMSWKTDQDGKVLFAFTPPTTGVIIIKIENKTSPTTVTVFEPEPKKAFIKLYLEDAIRPEGVAPMVLKISGDLIDVVTIVENSKNYVQNIKIWIILEYSYLYKCFMRNDFSDTDESNVLQTTKFGCMWSTNIELDPLESTQVVWRLRLYDNIPISILTVSGLVCINDELCDYATKSFSISEFAKGIIVTNRHLLYERYDEDEVTSLLLYMYNWADDENLIIYYLDHYNDIAFEDIMHWDQDVDYTNQNTANIISNEIDYLIEEWAEKSAHIITSFPSRKFKKYPYLIIIGSDEIVPFYRVNFDDYDDECYCSADDMPFLNDKKNDGVSDCRDGGNTCAFSNDPVLRTYCEDYFLTDMKYADMDDIDWTKGSINLISSRIVGASAEDMKNFIRNAINSPSNSDNTVIGIDDETPALINSLERLRDNKGLNILNDGNPATETPVTFNKAAGWGANDIVDALEQGCCIFEHTNHGDYFALSSPDKTLIRSNNMLWDISLVENISLYHPFVVTDSCHTGVVTDQNGQNWNPNPADNLAWAFINAGVSGYLGQLSYGLIHESDILLSHFFDILISDTGTQTRTIGGSLRNSISRYTPSGSYWTTRDQVAVTEPILYGLPWMVIDPPNENGDSDEYENNFTINISKPKYISSDTYSINIELNVTDYEISQIKEFDIINISGSTEILVDNHPLIPKINIPIYLPNSAEIINLSNIKNIKTFVGNYNLPCFLGGIRSNPTNWTNCSDLTGCYPKDPFWFYSSNFSDHKLVSISIPLAEYWPVTNETYICNFSKLELIYKTISTATITDFSPNKTEYQNGEIINISTTINNIGSDILTNLQANLRVIDKFGETKLLKQSELFKIESGETKILGLEFSQNLTAGTYLLVLNITGSGTLASASEYISISSGEIISFNNPSTVITGNEIEFEILFKNQKQTIIDAYGEVYIFYSNGSLLTEIPSNSISVDPNSTESFIITWNTLGKEPGEYIADAIVYTDYESFGPLSNTFTIIPTDSEPPITIKTIGNPKFGENDEWVTSATEFNLAAFDNLSGVDKTYYRIWYNGSWTLWMEYIGNFKLDGDGIHYLEYFSIDYIGNVEEKHNQTHYVYNNFILSQVTQELTSGMNAVNAITAMDVYVNVTTTASTKIVLTELAGNPYPDVPEPNGIVLNKYIDIKIEDESVVEWPIIIKIYYPVEDLEEIGLTADQDNLIEGIYYWYDISESWQIYENTGVNTTDINGYKGYIYAYADHLTPIVPVAFEIEEWVARYNGPGNGNDFVMAFDLDSSTGNIYLTGYTKGINSTHFNYATVAYDSEGNELWAEIFNGLGNGNDQANDIAVDQTTGNVYVTGWATGVGTGKDYATVAYDSTGDDFWNRTYNDPAKNGDDEAVAIAIHPITGEIIVTGYCVHPHSRDYSTLAYNPSNGSLIWEAIYSNPAMNDYARALAIDPVSGNIYVTGYCQGGGYYAGIETVAYNLSGAELWNSRYEVSGSIQDCPHSIAVDPISGNVYVTGHSWSTETGKDYATIAYDYDGVELWNKSYNGPGNNDDISNEVVVDPYSGNVYITGQSIGNGTDWDCATIAYDSSGNELWVKRYNGPSNSEDLASDIAINSSGHIIVTGGAMNATTNRDYTTISYNPDGMEQWILTYDGPYNYYDVAFCVLIDSSNDVYVTGRSIGEGTGYDYATIRYDPSYFSTSTFGYVKNVDKDKIYDTIQEAVDDADSGDTLFVSEGVFYENVLINKSLTLIGENTDTTIIDGKNSWYVVKVIEDGVNISGFTIRNSSYGLQGIYLDSSSNNTITNCKIYDTYQGILPAYSHNNLIKDCIIYDNSHGIDVGTSNNNTIINCTGFNNGKCIGLTNSLYNRIINCTTYDSIDGIILWNASNNIITNCKAYNNNETGICIRTNSNNNTLTHSIAYNNNRGIHISSYADNNMISYCTAYNNRHGFYIFGAASYNTIYNCISHNNTNHGIRLEDYCNSNIITDCTINNNSWGIYMRDYCENNIFANCTIFNHQYCIRLGVLSNFNTINNCIVYNTTYGIQIATSNNIITNCEVYNSIVSISIRDSSSNTVKNCIAFNNRDGIKFPSSINNTITNCTSYNNTLFGIQLFNCSYSTLTDCTTYDNPVGIVLNSDSSNNTITNCKTYNNQKGIYNGYSSNNLITNSLIDNNTRYGIHIHYSTYNNISNCIVTSHNLSEEEDCGIILQNSNNNFIVNNTVSYNERGLSLKHSYLNEIKLNLITNNYYGIHLYHSNNNTIFDNIIEDNEYGIYDPESEENTISDNYIADNEYGIYLEETENSNIDSNILTGNQNDIYLTESDNNEITGNRIIENMNGIYLEDSENNIIENNEIEDKDFGIYDPSSNNNTFRNNTIHNCEYGITVKDSECNTITENSIYENNYGIYLNYTNNITIQNNTINDNTYGIYDPDSQDNTITDNYVADNEYGVLFENTENSTIDNNTVTGNQNDIYLTESDNNEITGNRIIRNMNGIYLDSSDYNTIEENTIEDKDNGIVDPNSNYNIIKNNLIHNCGIGITVEDSEYNTITENSLSENTYGVIIDEDSTDNEIFYNNFVDNNIQAEDEGDNTWDDGMGTGNFWSDYTGEDTNGDGIGETPYQELDQYPIIEPPSNAPPVADADGPYFGAVGEEITFNASDSYDYNEDDELQYRWDFNNDSIWDTDWSNDPTSTYTWDYEYSGIVVVEVNDSEYTDTDSTTITVRTIEATIVFNPETLNLLSKGKPVTVYIELPEDYYVEDINISSLLLNGIVPAETWPWEIEDEDEDGIPDLKVNFNRYAVQAILKVGEEESIVITGALNDGTPFGGDDRIRTIKEE